MCSLVFNFLLIILCILLLRFFYQKLTSYMDINYYDYYELIQNIKITKALTRDNPSFKTAPLRFGGQF